MTRRARDILALLAVTVVLQSRLSSQSTEFIEVGMFDFGLSTSLENKSEDKSDKNSQYLIRENCDETRIHFYL